MGRYLMIVLDTAAVVYAAIDTAKLSLRAEQAIIDADQIIVSSITIWEIGLKVKQGKLTLPFSVLELLDRLKQVDRVTIAPVEVNTWLKNVELAWEHKDPADRTIVATASLLGCPLVTPDQRVRSFYPSTIW